MLTIFENYSHLKLNTTERRFLNAIDAYYKSLETDNPAMLTGIFLGASVAFPEAPENLASGKWHFVTNGTDFLAADLEYAEMLVDLLNDLVDVTGLQLWDGEEPLANPTEETDETSPLYGRYIVNNPFTGRLL